MINELLNKKSVWEKLMNEERPIVLYGMGNGADRVLKEFELLGINVGGVMASDDFVRGQKFHDFTVKTFEQHKEELGDFVILITFGTDREDVMNHIKELNDKYTVLVPSVPVAGSSIFNRSYLMKNGTEIEIAYDLMADEMSRKTFRNICYFQYTGELKYLFEIESSKDDAYKILNLTSEENYLDLGAYRGDTIDEFLKYTCNQYKTITAVEPDPKTYEKLVESKGDLANTKLLNMGVWIQDTEIPFILDKGRGSSIRRDGVLTKTTCINSLAGEREFTYIKMDIEGAEFVVLSGGNELLESKKPKLNIACYHRCSDIYKLPTMLNRINKNYKIYMRHHPSIPGWETNLYCI